MRMETFKMMLVLTLLTIGLYDIQFNRIDTEIYSYVEDVKRISRNNLGTRTSKIIFSKNIDNILGRCYTGLDLIEINKKEWNRMTDWSRIMLLAHEIAHCECRTKHITRYRWDGCPLHFMHSHEGGTYCNYRYKNSYISQMRNLECPSGK